MTITISYQDNDNITRVKVYRGIDKESVEFYGNYVEFKHKNAYTPYKVELKIINAIVMEDTTR